ncbi:hypothetical protein HBN50_00190 [Halobacteriovorax sp. GB3]|uniref:hypothetical protein n=1 Tax=Halobacteriovorax sp. GB3 TaxID=2719615 RepID=UPI00235EFA0A|nr:hypothetical protein [Halobacteriovorax sp. GB3]MDD0851485.1 hypothetical protein [Halobacteriovorax sp. GB3]
MKKAISAFIIYLCSFQLAFASVVENQNRFENDAESYFDTFKKQSENYKKVVSGYDKKVDENCEDPKPESNFDLSSLLGGQDTVSYEGVNDESFFKELKDKSILSCDEKKEVSEVVQEQALCKREHIPGSIGHFTKKMMDKKDFDQIDYNIIRSQTNEAMKYKKDIQRLMDSDLSFDIKREAVLHYIHNVLLPYRDLFVVTRKATNGSKVIFDSLYPVFDAELFVTEEEVSKISLGIDQYNDPVFNNLVELEEGMSIRFDEAKMVKRDIITLMKAPSADNYFQVLRWFTVNMLLQQKRYFSSVLNAQDDLVDVPLQCQEKMENGSLPSKVEFTINKKFQGKHAEILLSNLGYVDGEYGAFAREYFLENSDSDARIDSYSGIVPFEEYSLAKIALYEKSSKYFEPSLDDTKHYELVMKANRGELYNVFENDEEMKTFLSIIDRAKKNREFEVLEDGEVSSFIAYDDNLSPYLANYLQRKGLSYIDNALPEGIVRKLKRNKIKIEFPSFNSSSFWRMWALRSLSSVLKGMDKKSKEYSRIMRIITNDCGTGMRINLRNPICFNTSGKFNGVVKALDEFAVSDSYVPVRRMKEAKVDKLYPMLAKIWNYLRDKTDLLSDATIDEYTFILNQIYAGNEFARARLGYVLAEYEMMNFIFEEAPIHGRKISCEARASRLDLFKLRKAAKKFGLNKPLTPFYADSILDDSKKEYVWGEIYKKKNSESEQLLTAKLSGGDDVFKIMESLSSETILDRNAIEKFNSKNLSNLSEKRWDDINYALSSVDGERIQLLGDLYKERGNLEKQQKILAQYSKYYSLDDDFQVKDDFFSLENALKKPVFLELIERAAKSKLKSLDKQLEKLCMTNMDDHEQIKKIFHGTSNVQNNLNQILGLQSVPVEVQEKLDEWTKDEYLEIGVGFGAPIISIAAYFMAGTCIVATGGLCGALVLGLSGLGLAGQSYLAVHEYNKHVRSKDHVNFVKGMEDLGVANAGSNDEMSHSLGWAAFEAAGAFALLSVVGRSYKVGTNVWKTSSKAIARNSSLSKEAQKSALRESGESIGEDAQTEFARHVLGMDGKQMIPELERVAKERDLKEILVRIQRVKDLQAQGLMTKSELKESVKRITNDLAKHTAKDDHVYKFVSNEVAYYSKEAVDQRTAEVVSAYFHNNDKMMLDYLKSLDSLLLSKHSKLAKARKINMNVKNGTYTSKFLNFFRKLRYRSTAENATKMKKMISKLEKGAPDLTFFVKENMEDFTDFFFDGAVKKRGFLHEVFTKGGPHIGGAMSGGRRIRYVQTFSDDVIMRKFFNARARLVLESSKREARELLGLSENVKADRVVDAIKAFNDSVGEVVLKSEAKEAQSIAKMYLNFQESVAKDVVKKVGAKKIGNTGSRELTTVFNQELGIKQVRELMFHPKTIQEKAVGDSLWRKIDINKFLGEQTDDFAHVVVRKLSGYSKVSEFESYLNALRLLVMKNQKGVVEIF